jgi:2-keto-4-pentenoate hydratase
MGVPHLIRFWGTIILPTATHPDDSSCRSAEQGMATTVRNLLAVTMPTQDLNRLTFLADQLWFAEQDRTPIDPLGSRGVPLSPDDAYAVQRMNVRRRIDAGERPVGHKVGLTSQAMQDQLGVDSPDFGIITDAMIIASGGELDLGALIAPRIEAEFAFIFNRRLRGTTKPSLEDLRGAIEGVALALEIIDSRIIDWKIGLSDTVADNASSARIVVGPVRPASPDLFGELIDTQLSLAQDDNELAAGPGSAVLGDPLNALLWLSDALFSFGEGFEKGDVVLAGAVHASVPLAPGCTFSARAEGFSPVSVGTSPTRLADPAALAKGAPVA